MKKEPVWININEIQKRKADRFASLFHFFINNLHWVLNYRGDAPLLQFRENEKIKLLQIDGDIFSVDEVKWQHAQYEEEVFDSYLFPTEEALKFINILLYEDIELEYDPTIDEEQMTGDDYDLNYEGSNEIGFNKFLQKVEKQEEILERDIVGL